VRSFPVIAAVLITLSGCGSDKSGQTSDTVTTKQTDTTSASGVPSKDSEAPPAQVAADDAIYIDCQYTDKSNVSYKIENSTISSFSEAENKYIENAIYAANTWNGGKYSWTGPGQVQNVPINLQENSESFDIDIGGTDSNNPKTNRMTINRKTGSVSDTPYNWMGGGNLVTNMTKITARCTPSASKVSEQNSF
jgi:archaellin